jgi:hypothetical protein
MSLYDPNNSYKELDRTRCPLIKNCIGAGYVSHVVGCREMGMI